VIHTAVEFVQFISGHVVFPVVRQLLFQGEATRVERGCLGMGVEGLSGWVDRVVGDVMEIAIWVSLFR